MCFCLLWAGGGADRTGEVASDRVDDDEVKDAHGTREDPPERWLRFDGCNNLRRP